MNSKERGDRSIEVAPLELKIESDEDSGGLFDSLYKATMECQWGKVVKILEENKIDHGTKLTNSLDTPLHAAISSYHPKTASSHEQHVTEMIRVMKRKETLARVMAMQNQRGDTPLHVAAAVGWLTIFDSMEEKDRSSLLHSWNKKGETPLFVAALHGNLGDFRRLLDTVKPALALFRRKDGNTILHRAIFEENFELAYMIIGRYPKMVEFINEDGEYPLHVLAKKPNVFKSSSHLRIYDSIIYYCVFVEKLSNGRGDPPPEKPKNPEIYTTCVKMFSFIRENIVAIFKKRPSRAADEENHPHQGHGPQSENLSNGRVDPQPKYPENYTTCVKIFSFIPESMVTIFKKGPSCAADEENHYHQEHGPQNKGKSYYDLFPNNYVTCIDLFKFAMKVILIILGVGFWRIQKIKEKKKRYLNAMEVLDKMMEKEAGYKYDNKGQRPPQEVSAKIEIPEAQPQSDNDGKYKDTTGTTTAPQSDNDGNDKDTTGKKAAKAEGFTTNNTPLLEAAKTGILEIVKKIHKKCHVSIQDLGSKEKNVLMLAAEHRHTAVFNYLISDEAKLPKYMFHQFDEDGNSILHLAAKFTELYPWRIPGAALQMQWEIKWYKHVKKSLSTHSISQPNREKKTPRAIFTQTHKELRKAGNDWLIKTSESCSVVAALIAAVAFATSSTVPGGLSQDKGKPILLDKKAFDVFAVASLVALCLSVTALVFFLAIITSRCEEHDFKRNLPRKLLGGLSSLFASIAAILLSFCSGHTFILREDLKFAVIPIYASISIPVAFFAIAQLPLYFDLLWAAYRKVPLRSYKVFCY